MLFLWATQAMMLQAAHVMAAWGFAYKSQFVWRKLYPGNQTGMGHWNRSVHELLLIGTRGRVPAPAPRHAMGICHRRAGARAFAKARLGL